MMPSVFLCYLVYFFGKLYNVVCVCLDALHFLDDTDFYLSPTDYTVANFGALCIQEKPPSFDFGSLCSLFSTNTIFES